MTLFYFTLRLLALNKIGRNNTFGRLLVLLRDALFLQGW